MNIVDPDLRQRVERVLASDAAASRAPRTIFALMDAYDWFRLTVGGDCAPVQEAAQQLLSPELRPALRQWYQSFSGPLNPVASAFRQHLSTLAGEPL